MTYSFLAIFGLGPTEMIIVGIVAVLLFGKRLPEVARSMGKGMMEFKKGMHGIEEEVRSAGTATSGASSGSSSSSAYDGVDDTVEATAPKFDPPTAEPRASAPEESEFVDLKEPEKHEA